MSNKQSDAPRAVGYVNVPPDVASVVRGYAIQNGERAAQEHWNLSRIVIARASAGMAVQRATLLALRDGIARLEARAAGVGA